MVGRGVAPVGSTEGQQGRRPWFISWGYELEASTGHVMGTPAWVLPSVPPALQTLTFNRTPTPSPCLSHPPAPFKP